MERSIDDRDPGGLRRRFLVKNALSGDLELGMPFKHITKPVSGDAEALLEPLIEEMRKKEERGAGPKIIVEGYEKKGPLHVYVVWDQWKDISLQERSRLIMEAFRQVEPEEDFLRDTIAMGLTPDEAPRYGIEVEKIFS